MAGFYLGVSKGGISVCIIVCGPCCSDFGSSENHTAMCQLHVVQLYCDCISLLLLMCLSQISTFALDTSSILGLLAVCFIIMNLVLANYVVDTINLKKELKVRFY